MHSLVDYVWVGKTVICPMHNAIDYSYIGKKTNLQYAWIVRQVLELSIGSQKWFTVSLDNWISFVWRNYYPWTVILTVCAKNTIHR